MGSIGEQHATFLASLDAVLYRVGSLLRFERECRAHVQTTSLLSWPHGVPCLGEEIPEAGVAGQVWVVGVEDFMRRFLPGKSNAKSIFALAQLNGIVKYACLKVGVASIALLHWDVTAVLHMLLHATTCVAGLSASTACTLLSPCCLATGCMAVASSMY